MTKRSISSQILGFIVWLLIISAAAALGGAASMDSGTFYAKLVRPEWAPPSWVFGPVWSVLYLLMVIAAWLVWRENDTRHRKVALGVFLVQLAANALWTWLFFAWRNGALAFAEILVLLALIVITMVLFWRVRPLAALLLIPYLAWVTFASALTWSIWRNNPSLL